MWRLLLYSVCIERITNIPLAEKDTVVEMQAGIYNGGKKLREMTTGPISLKQGIVWKEKLIFDLTIQRIPKVVIVVVTELNKIYIQHTITDCTIIDCYKREPSREKKKFCVYKSLCRIILGCNIFDRSQVHISSYYARIKTSLTIAGTFSNMANLSYACGLQKEPEMVVKSHGTMIEFCLTLIQMVQS